MLSCNIGNYLIKGQSERHNNDYYYLPFEKISTIRKIIYCNPVNIPCLFVSYHKLFTLAI